MSDKEQIKHILKARKYECEKKKNSYFFLAKQNNQRQLKKAHIKKRKSAQINHSDLEIVKHFQKTEAEQVLGNTGEGATITTGKTVVGIATTEMQNKTKTKTR